MDVIVHKAEGEITLKFFVFLKDCFSNFFNVSLDLPHNLNTDLYTPSLLTLFEIQTDTHKKFVDYLQFIDQFLLQQLMQSHFVLLSQGVMITINN